MSKPKWTEAWQDAFEESYPEQQDGPKKAVAVRQEEDGTTTVLRAASGAEAERMIAEAEAQGLEVRRDVTEVEGLLAEQGSATDVPPEVYDLMSAVIGFAQELDQEWEQEKKDLLPSSPAGSTTEIEYTLDDI